VPSKKALAAKARRRAGIASKADEQTRKLTLLEAIAVLRVSAPPTLLEQLQFYHLVRPLKLHHRIRSMSFLSRLRLKMASLCLKDVSIFQEKLNPELRKRFSYLQRGDKRKRQKRRVRILWVAQSLSTECVPSAHHIHICSTEHLTDSQQSYSRDHYSLHNFAHSNHYTQARAIFGSSGFDAVRT
jgi:hypothetical protein